MSEIRAGYGKMSLANSTTTLSAFRVHAPFVRDSLVASGRRRINAASRVPVSQHPAINGYLYADQIEHDAGTICLLTMSHRVRSCSLRDGAVLLRLRDGAAMLNISAKLPVAVDQNIGPEFSMFHGRADILSVDQVEVLGFRVPARFVDQYFHADEVAECFNVVEVAPELQGMPTISAVATSSGVIVTEIQQRPARRMRFRKEE